MKMVKSLLLVSAAGLVAISGAQAADLPVKAKPVEYVKVCSLYGVGFYYVPGTDICLKIGAYFRAEYAFGAVDNGLTNLDFDRRRIADPHQRPELQPARPFVHLPGYPSADRLRHPPGLYEHRTLRRLPGRPGGLRQPRVHAARRLHLGPRDVVLRLLLVAGDLVLGSVVERHRRRRLQGGRLHRAARQRRFGDFVVRTAAQLGDREHLVQQRLHRPVRSKRDHGELPRPTIRSSLALCRRRTSARSSCPTSSPTSASIRPGVRRS